MGRADDPRVDRDRLAAADPLDHALLQEAQQLHLQRQRNVANLVEEQRAAIGLLDLALGGLDCAGERPLLVSEQFAFEQVFRDRRAIDRDEFAIGAVAGIVEASRQQFLARPARAEQHDRDVGVRHALDRPRHADHFGRGGDHPPKHLVVVIGADRELAVFLLDLVEA